MTRIAGSCVHGGSQRRLAAGRGRSHSDRRAVHHTADPACVAGRLHLAVVSRRLAAMATIFLPILFLAGFWGQNFSVITDSIEQGWPAFLFLGVGLRVVCVLGTVFILRRRRWN